MPAFNDDFTVINTSGIHPVGVDYCACETTQDWTTQLLRAEWFPRHQSESEDGCNISRLRDVPPFKLRVQVLRV